MHIATLRAQARPRKHDRATDTSSHPRGLSQSCICAWCQCHGEEPTLGQAYSDGSHANKGDTSRPMIPDLAEAVQPLSAAQQVNSCTSCTTHTQCSAYALVARHEEPIGQHLVRKAVWCCRGRPATNPTPQLSTYAGSTQITVTSCKRRPIWAIIAIGLHD